MRARALFLMLAGVLAMGVLGPAAAAADPLPVPTNFYAGVAAELANPGGSLPGSNDYGCEPSAEHPNPVVLLHDMGATRQSNWATFIPALANEGYCVYSISYGVIPGVGSTSAGSPLGGFAPLADSAHELGAFVDDVLAAPGTRRGVDSGTVDIIGHGEGALVANYYTKVLGGAPNVDRFVALAPTWEGFGGDLARKYGGENTPEQFRGALEHECPYCIDGAAGSDFMAQLNARGSPYAPGVKYTNIVTRYNWGLDYTSGLVPGPNVTNIVVQDGCESDYSEHDGVGASPRALAFALNALDPGNPRPVPCGTILPFAGTMVG